MIMHFEKYKKAFESTNGSCNYCPIFYKNLNLKYFRDCYYFYNKFGSDKLLRGSCSNGRLKEFIQDKINELKLKK